MRIITGNRVDFRVGYRARTEVKLRDQDRVSITPRIRFTTMVRTGDSCRHQARVRGLGLVLIAL